MGYGMDQKTTTGPKTQQKAAQPPSRRVHLVYTAGGPVKHRHAPRTKLKVLSALWQAAPYTCAHKSMARTCTSTGIGKALPSKMDERKVIIVPVVRSYNHERVSGVFSWTAGALLHLVKDPGARGTHRRCHCRRCCWCCWCCAYVHEP